MHRYAVVGDAGPGGDQVRGARDAGQLQAAGDVVVVDVRLDDVGYPHPRRAAAAISRSMSRGGSTTTAVRSPPARWLRLPSPDTSIVSTKNTGYSLPAKLPRGYVWTVARLPPGYF